MASEAEEDEGLASPENANLRSHFVISGSGGCNDFYNIGIFDAGEDSKSVAIIGITDIDGSILVALPEFGWAQKKAERVLPKGALSKVRAVRVTSCRIGDRTAASDVPSLKIWLGLLDPSFEEFVKVDPFEAPSVDFPGEDQEQCIPFGPALVAVCQDHFVFQSAESQGAVGTEPIVLMEQRLKAMEEMIVGLTRQLAPGQSYVGPTPKKKAARAAERGKGLDDAALQQALQSGVAPHLLQEMSKIVGPPGLPSRAAPAGFQHAVGSSEEEEEKEPGEEEQGDAVATGSADPVQQAVVQLTKLVTHLGADQVRKKDKGLEALLDRAESGSVGESSTTSSRSKAAALRMLQKTLKTDPKLIYQILEQKLEEDWQDASHLPGSSRGAVTARAWFEHRSKVQAYPAAIRSGWALAGIWDCLMSNRVSEARARAGLALAQLDQQSYDRGNFLLASEIALEAPPPYSSFQTHQLPDPWDLPHSRLLEPRWVELFMHRLKEVSDYQEKKLKLTQIKKAEDPEQPKQKGKGKNGKGDSQPAAGGGDRSSAPPASQ